MLPPLISQASRPALAQALRLAMAFAAAKLLLTFALTLWTQHLGYSYFRDEFYYIACGRHLAWGYVDHGPIVALQARLGEALFGTSLFATRIFSALAGAVMVFLTGLLAWSLDGRRPAQALAMTGIILCPQFIGTDGFLSMNSFEPVFWAACLLAVILIQRGYSERLWWSIFGLSAGIGLLNKPSMTFFLISLAAALIFTPQRRFLFTRYAALGTALLILIALPNILWQIHYHWPTLEFLRQGRMQNKNVIYGPVQFLTIQILNMHPLNAFLWVTGVVALLRNKSIRHTQWLGLTFLFFFVIMFALHAKDYYLAPIYPAFFAVGAIAWEHRFGARKLVQQNRIFGFPVYQATLLVTTAIILPLASPVLRPETLIRYTTATHLRSDHSETSATGPLPQFYADRFGWNQQVSTVVDAFHALTPADQQAVCLYADNYGEAGALDFLGHRAEPRLPPAFSPHNSYWWWGTHGCTMQVVIAISGGSPEELRTKYEEVTILAHMDDTYAMPHEHKNIYLLRRRRPENPFDWERARFYI